MHWSRNRKALVLVLIVAVPAVFLYGMRDCLYGTYLAPQDMPGGHGRGDTANPAATGQSKLAVLPAAKITIPDNQSGAGSAAGLTGATPGGAAPELTGVATNHPPAELTALPSPASAGPSPQPVESSASGGTLGWLGSALAGLGIGSAPPAKLSAAACARCGRCEAGDSSDGGKGLTEAGMCLGWCSAYNFCGDERYAGATDSGSATDCQGAEQCAISTSVLAQSDGHQWAVIMPFHGAVGSHRLAVVNATWLSLCRE